MLHNIQYRNRLSDTRDSRHEISIKLDILPPYMGGNVILYLFKGE